MPTAGEVIKATESVVETAHQVIPYIEQALKLFPTLGLAIPAVMVLEAIDAMHDPIIAELEIAYKFFTDIGHDKAAAWGLAKIEVAKHNDPNSANSSMFSGKASVPAKKESK